MISYLLKTVQELFVPFLFDEIFFQLPQGIYFI